MANRIPKEQNQLLITCALLRVGLVKTLSVDASSCSRGYILEAPSLGRSGEGAVRFQNSPVGMTTGHQGQGSRAVPPLDHVAVIAGARLLPHPEMRTGTPATVHPLALGTRHGVFLFNQNGIRAGVALFTELIHPDMIPSWNYQQFGNWFVGGTLNMGYRWR